MTFTTAIRTCYAKYGDFNGRACRSEFWYFILATTPLFAVLSMKEPSPDDLIHLALNLVVALALALPSIAVSVRRMHDTDLSGWWVLAFMVPLVGSVLTVLWFSRRGTDGPNRFGEDPLAPPPSGLADG